MRIRFRFQSLSTQITILVLAVLFVLTLVIGSIAYQIARNTIESQGVSSLEALASARQLTIEAYVNDHLEKLDAFEQPDLEIEVAELLAASGTERTIQHDLLVADLQRKHLVDPHMEWAEIIDLGGVVIASTIPARENILYAEDMPVFATGQIRPYISDPFIEAGRIYLELSLPLHNAANSTVGVLLLRINARDLLTITGEYSGLGETGETVLGTRRGDEIYFLTPLRFDPNLSDIAPAPTDGERAKPMIHATSGQSGVTSAPDYRGVQVIAAYRPIQVTGWGVVVKQDEAEIFAGAAQIRSSLIVGLAIALLVGSVIIIPLTRAFVQPLTELEQATRKVASGDLTTHVPVSQLNEVGQVAEAFNAMVAQLALARDDLTQSNQELSSFAYVVSHDLKTPLRGIASLSEWLVEDLEGKLESEQIEQLGLLLERVQRMDALINGLLDYSRVGRVRNPEIAVDVDTLLVRVIDTISPSEKIQICVTTKMPRLKTDELHLIQVFQNLISNAVSHHPGRQGIIEISSRDEGDFWEFAVHDDGAGIEARHHERIFQMFQSLQTNKDVDSTGIGLALVRKIVEEHGCSVWVESQGLPGQGSIFRFTWPKTI